MRLVVDRDFRLGSRSLMTQLGHRLPARVFDLLRLAMGVMKRSVA